MDYQLNTMQLFSFVIYHFQVLISSTKTLLVVVYFHFQLFLLLPLLQFLFLSFLFSSVIVSFVFLAIFVVVSITHFGMIFSFYHHLQFVLEFLSKTIFQKCNDQQELLLQFQSIDLKTQIVLLQKHFLEFLF